MIKIDKNIIMYVMGNGILSYGTFRIKRKLLQTDEIINFKFEDYSTPHHCS